MTGTQTVSAQLHALSLHLGCRRRELLRVWRQAVRRDPELATNASLPRSALDDHIPTILQDLEGRLRAEHALDAMRIELQERKDAGDHGMHRWQQGYDIRETMREWGHLHALVQEELENYAAGHPELEPAVMPTARKILGALCMEGNCESAARYVRLQETEAASRVRDLEASMAALQALEDERARLLHEAAHDLRGNVGVIASTTALLATPTVLPAQRDRFQHLLQQRIHSTGALLNELVELARLEAGQDPVKIEPFDAAERLRAYCEILRPTAAERNLFLKYEGPETLPVEGDAGKLQRIVQNLLLNALKATEHGGVVVRWSKDETPDARQWILSISDTGPGFDSRSAGPLRQAWKRATEKAHDIDAGIGDSAAEDTKPDLDLQRPQYSALASTLPSGEGIGLSIVTRLCRILDATIELDAAEGRGSTFRIAFPLRYAST